MTIGAASGAWIGHRLVEWSPGGGASGAGGIGGRPMGSFAGALFLGSSHFPPFFPSPFQCTHLSAPPGVCL